MKIITEQERERLRAMGRKGGLARAKQFTSEYQRAVRAHVSHESCVANGRKGGIAYVKKYGKRKLVEQARQYRLGHLSDLEQIVLDALDQVGALNLEYEREGYVFPRSHCHHNTGDFLFRKAKMIIYADGAAWHNGKDLPLSFANCADRAMRDETMDHYLRGRGWRVLRLSESEIKAHTRGDGGAMLEKLHAFIWGAR
jgi:very-short-patch-repair endonuclease